MKYGMNLGSMMTVAVLAAALSGCTVRSGPPAGTRIAVQEFAIPRDVVVQRYSGNYLGLGMQYAQFLVTRLTRLGYQAAVVPQGAPMTGDLNITGSIAEIDGGNATKRILLGAGAGHSEFDVFGTVTRADGRVLGEFTESRASSGGWTAEGSLEQAMQRTVNEVARMVYTGEYRRNAPADRPATKAFAASQAAPAAADTVETRIHALDRLLADGTITSAEYAAKRAAIIDGL
jgi:uncharacterized protein DUF4410